MTSTLKIAQLFLVKYNFFKYKCVLYILIIVRFLEMSTTNVERCTILYMSGTGTSLKFSMVIAVLEF
jgi:hypothetical protein